MVGDGIGNFQIFSLDSKFEDSERGNIRSDLDMKWFMCLDLVIFSLNFF